jgi:hypothetical protein
VQGVGKKMIRDTVSGGLVGGTLSGGLNAAMAEPGERGSAFASGFGSGALSGAGFGAISGVGEGLVNNAKRMRFRDLSKTTGTPMKQLVTRSKDMGWRDAASKSFKAPDPMNPLGKMDQGIARTKMTAGLGFLGAQVAPDIATSVFGGSSSEPPPPPPPMPQYQPNAPAVYSQPQYYKSSSAKIQLRPIDFTNLPSYH